MNPNIKWLAEQVIEIEKVYKKSWDDVSCQHYIPHSEAVRKVTEDIQSEDFFFVLMDDITVWDEVVKWAREVLQLD